MLPVSCAGCGRWDVALCPDCRSLLTGEPIAVEHADAAGDLDVSALAVYAGPVRPMVLGWKNGAREDLAAFMTDVGARAGRRWARRLDEEVREAVEVEGLTFREGLNATVVSGGTAGNVIPDTAELYVNYRFAPDVSTEDALAAMRRTFERPGVDFEVLDLSPAARPGLDRPAARQFCAAVGGEPGPKYGWTDVARFSALGVPAVNYGPGDAGKAHAVDECCPLDDLDAARDALLAWLRPGGGHE